MDPSARRIPLWKNHPDCRLWQHRPRHCTEGQGLRNEDPCRQKHLSTELFADHVYTQEELMDVLPKADIVIAALPSTPDTENFFGADQFAAMKKTALFINIARASIVDENALIDALEKGSIAGACLDVFSKEPLPADHPFWKMKNVIMTPHTASMVPDFWNKLTALLQTNFVNFSRGEKLMNEMDKKKGY